MKSMSLEKIAKESAEYADANEILGRIHSAEGHTINGLQEYFGRRGMLENPNIKEQISLYDKEPSTKKAELFGVLVAGEKKQAVEAVKEDLDGAISYVSNAPGQFAQFLLQNKPYGKSDFAKAHKDARESAEFLNSEEGLGKKVQDYIAGKIKNLEEIGVRDSAVEVAKFLYSRHVQSLAGKIKEDAKEKLEYFGKLVTENKAGAQAYLNEMYSGVKDKEQDELAAKIALLFAQINAEAEKAKKAA